MILLFIVSISAPILGVYVDQRLGIEEDINGKQEEKFDDSLIPNHNFRKQRGNFFSGWRRFEGDDGKHPVFQDSYKDLFSKLRRDSRNATQYKGNIATQNNEIIDVKFRQLKPNRRSGGDTNFAYHDNMESGDFGDVQDYERNLQALVNKSHRKKNSRRININEEEYDKAEQKKQIYDWIKKHKHKEEQILFHHAVPIRLRISGYIRPQE